MGIFDLLLGKNREKPSQQSTQNTDANSENGSFKHIGASENLLKVEPFLFTSNCHQRYENGNPVMGLQQCIRTVRLEKNTNGCAGYRLEPGIGYIVKIFNDDLGKPNMSDKPMKIISVSPDKIELRGFVIEAQSPFGWQEVDYSDYGFTVFYKNEEVDKCTLHMRDRNIEIKYRRESIKQDLGVQPLHTQTNHSVVSISKGTDFELKFKKTLIRKVSYNGQEVDVLNSTNLGNSQYTKIKSINGIVTIDFQEEEKMKQLGILDQKIILKPSENGNMTYQKDAEGNEFATREFNTWGAFVSYYQITRQNERIVAFIIMNPASEPNTYYLAIMQEPFSEKI